MRLSQILINPRVAGRRQCDFLIIPNAVIFGLAALLISASVSAHDTDQRTPVVAVSAQGSVEVAPDMAVITMTVRRDAKTARQALDDNNAAMAMVLKSLKAEGVAARDLQTSGFSINPKMSYPNRSAADRTPRLIGYTVQNTLAARIRDLSRLGAVLDKSVSLGVNSGGQIQFTNDQPADIISQARTKAMKAAMVKASTLVKAAGVSLGRILEISEHSRTPQPVAIARGRMAATAMADEGSVPLQAGENSYSVTVNVRWALDQ